MQIAIVTGASSGLGKELFLRIPRYAQVEEIWVISRSREALEALRPLSPLPLRVLPLDLGEASALAAYRETLEETKPQVRLLIHAAGFGKFGRYDDFPLSDALNMVDLNVRATVGIVQETLPYMPEDSRILAMGSASAFQPLPFINVYGASKAFVLHYCRGLHRELKPRRISVTCVCPYWVKTPFFDRAKATKEPEIIRKTEPMADPGAVAEKALRDAVRGKDVSSYGLLNRIQQTAARKAPQGLVMRVWMKSQGLDRERKP